MTDRMETYNQFLAAENLARALLLKYGQEASLGKLVLYGDEQIKEAFAEVAGRLGYSVEKIAATDNSLQNPPVFRDRPGLKEMVGGAA
jgi:hypothetical protein